MRQTIITGSRKIYKYHIESDQSELSEMSGGELEHLSEIEQIINKQTNEKINKIVQKIMELKKINEQDAINEKNELYKKMSISHPELNDYDRYREIYSEIYRNMEDNKLGRLKKKLKKKSKKKSSKRKSKN